MTDQKNIFQRLADYEVSPPPDILLRVMQAVDTSKRNTHDQVLSGSLEKLQDFIVDPPLGAYTFIQSRINDPLKLSRLQDMETAPPAFVFDQIIKKIGMTGSRRLILDSLAKKAVRYRYHLAAACVVLLAAGWFLFKEPSSNPVIPPSGEIAKKAASPPTPATADTVARSTLATTSPVIKKGTAIVYTGKASVFLGEDQFKLDIVDNDLLNSCISFRYTAVPSFMKKEGDGQLFIRLDQYANISVSKSMGGMIKRMNSFRKNGKLTGRAKRQRARLDRWKKADTRYFDQSLHKNPMDPVDLGEFIFH